MKKLRIAVISRWFIHVRKFAGLAQEYEESEVAAVWDYDKKRGEEFARELGVPFEPDYEVLLQDKTIDAFIVTAPVSMRTDLIIRAMRAGKHVFTEKPLAVSLEEGYAIQDAVKETGVHFVMSDPIVKPAMLHIRKLLADDLIGKVTSVRIRIGTPANVSAPDEWALSHTAKEMGGGDLIDVGHHTVHTLEWLLGKPESVLAQFGSFSERAKREQVEDNAVAIYKFKDGVLGIAEVASVSTASSYDLCIYGTKGCIRATRTHIRYSVEEGVWVDIPDEEIPEGLPYILRYWILGILNGEKNREYDVDCSVRCLEMIMAAYASSGKELPIRYREDEKEED